MTQSGGNFLDDLLLGVKNVQDDGVTMPEEPTINFVGAVLVDDPVNHRTNVNISANPHAVSGTGFWHSTSGTLDAAASLVNLSTDTTGVLPLTDISRGGASTNDVLVWTGTQWAGSSTLGAATAGTFGQVLYQSTSAPAWVSRYMLTGALDFVTDCGADNTGATDCATAVNTMWTKLSTLAADPKLAQTTLKVYVPPGRYKIASATTEPNFLGLTTSFEICGVEDASIFEVNCGIGTFAFAFQNIGRAHIHDLTFVGTGNGATADCNYLWVCAAADIITWERCHFASILATTSVVYNASLWAMRDCRFTGCGALSAAAGVLQSTYASVEMRRVEFSDIPGPLNGYTFPGNKANNNVNWFRADSSDDPNLGPDAYYINIQECLFDESNQCAIYIKGGSTDNIANVTIEDCLFLPSNVLTPVDMIHIEAVNQLQVTNVRNSGFSASTVATLGIYGVAASYIRGLVVKTGTNSAYITADSASGLVEVENSPTLTTANIKSAATVTTVRTATKLAFLPPQSDIATTDFTVETQPPYAAAATNKNPAQYWINLNPNGVSGTLDGGFGVKYNGSAIVQMGEYSGNGSTFGAIWFAGNAGANFGFLGSTTTTQVNAPAGGNLYLEVGGTPWANLTSSSFKLGTFSTEQLAFSLGGTTPTIQSSTACTSFTIGTNKSAATLALQADAATTIQTLASTGTELANLSTPAAGTGPRLLGASGRFEVVDSDGTVRIF